MHRLALAANALIAIFIIVMDLCSTAVPKVGAMYSVDSVAVVFYSPLGPELTAVKIKIVFVRK